MILRIALDAEKAPSQLERGNRCSARSDEGVKYEIADLAAVIDELPDEFHGLGMRMRFTTHLLGAKDVEHARIAVPGLPLFEHEHTLVLLAEARADVHMHLVPDEHVADVVARIADDELAADVQVLHAEEHVCRCIGFENPIALCDHHEAEQRVLVTRDDAPLRPIALVISVWRVGDNKVNATVRQRGHNIDGGTLQYLISDGFHWTRGVWGA